MDPPISILSQDIAKMCMDKDYGKTNLSDCSVKSSDGYVFYLSKYILSFSSSIFKKYFEINNDTHELFLPHRGGGDILHEWLKTFHPTLSYVTTSINPLSLYKLIPIYHQYNIQKELDICHKFIMKVLNATENSIKVIVDTPNFQYDTDNVKNLTELIKLSDVLKSIFT